MPTPAPEAILRAIPPLRRALARWYGRVRRDLPWRRTRDPYRVWVSEIMLQQTTVAAVIPYWERFVAAFPDVGALAAAPEQEVLRLWSGLGYYRRARYLQAAAREVVARGGCPRDVGGWLALPGIGRYTAAAIASICFDVPAAVVDGNVERVLARLGAIAGAPKRADAARAIRSLADALIDPRAPGDWNQAVMELGATVCLPRNPRCAECPWRRRCAARASGEPERWPERGQPLDTLEQLRVAALVLDARGRVLVRQVAEGFRNAGLWELPAVLAREGDGATSATTWDASSAGHAAEAFRALGIAISPAPAIARVRHAITRHRIVTLLVEATLRGRGLDGTEWRWIERERAEDEPLTGEARKLVRALAPGIRTSPASSTRAGASGRGGRGPRRR